MPKKVIEIQAAKFENFTYKLVALRHEKITKLFLKKVSFKTWHVKRSRTP